MFFFWTFCSSKKHQKMITVSIKTLSSYNFIIDNYKKCILSTKPEWFLKNGVILPTLNFLNATVGLFNANNKWSVLFINVFKDILWITVHVCSPDERCAEWAFDPFYWRLHRPAQYLHCHRILPSRQPAGTDTWFCQCRGLLTYCASDFFYPLTLNSTLTETILHVLINIPCVGHWLINIDDFRSFWWHAEPHSDINRKMFMYTHCF